MGAASSATAAYTDATWANQLHGEWRSAEARELDRLGGAQREAVGRGESMKYKMKWLQSGLEQQEAAIQDALAKDPNAGRHEIQRQEVTRAVKVDSTHANLAKFSVKEWQNVKHNDLRAMALLDASKGNAQEGDPQDRMRQKYLAMGTPAAPPLQREARVAEAKAKKQRQLRQMKSLYRPRVSIPANWGAKRGAPDVKVADWRMNIFRAKKTAWRAVSTMTAFSAFLKHRGLHASSQPKVQRIDSFSYLIPQQLGADMAGWSTDAVKVQRALKEVKSIKRALDAATDARVQLERQQQEAEDASRKPTNADAGRAQGRPQQAQEQGDDEHEAEASSSPVEGPGAGGGLGRTAKPHVRGGMGGSLDLTDRSRMAGALRAGLLQGHASGPLPSAVAAGMGSQASSAGAGGSGGRWGGSGSTPLRPSTQRGARPGSVGVVPGAPGASWCGAPLVRGSVDCMARCGGTAAMGTAVPMGSAARARFATLQQQQQQQQQLLLQSKEGGMPKAAGRGRAAWAQSAGKSMKRASGGAAGAGPKSVEEARQQEGRLAQQYKEEAQLLSRPLRMLAMFSNRSNAKWVEARAWEPAHVHQVADFGKDVKGGASSAFREQAVQALRDGKVVMQVLRGGQEHSITAQHGLDVWSTDPWEFIAAVNPARAETLDKLPGVNMGLRVLMALVTAVSAAAGPEAVANLMVVLHVHEGQEPRVFQDLMEHSHCGLTPEHVVVVTQHRRKGYVYSAEQRGFVQDPESAEQEAGSGFSMLQLCWESEANWVNTAGQPVRVMSSVLDYLVLQGRTWMLTKHVQDLSTLHPDFTLDVDSLAYALYLRDAQGANMAVEVEYVDVAGTNSVSTMQGLVLGSKVLRPTPPPGGPRSAAGGSSQPRVNRPQDATGPGPSTPPTTTPSPPPPPAMKHAVCAIKMCDLRTPKTQPLLQDPKFLQPPHRGPGSGANGRSGRRAAAFTGRCAWHLPSLQGLLTSPSVFHPSLVMAAQEGVVYAHLSASDLTSTPEARCVALHAEGARPKTMHSVEDVEALTSVVSAQDASGPFRRLVGSTATSGAKAAAGKGQGPSGAMGLKRQEEDTQADIAAKKARKYTGQRIVFLVADNSASQLALQLAQSIFKPGKDLVMFMTIVPNSLAVPAGKALMNKYMDAARATCVEAVAEVKVKAESLIDQLDNYVEECNADLVIMGSMVLAGGGASTSTVMGSISLCLMKTLSRPLLIVKANAKHANIAWEHDKLRAVVAVDHGSRPLLKYMCTKLMNALRCDQLFLARGGATDTHAQETGISRRLLENFAEIASSNRFAPIKKPLAGSFDADVLPVTDAEKIHIIAIQAPAGRASLPDSLIKLLRNTHSALLFYKGVDL